MTFAFASYACSGSTPHPAAGGAPGAATRPGPAAADERTARAYSDPAARAAAARARPAAGCELIAPAMAAVRSVVNSLSPRSDRAVSGGNPDAERGGAVCCLFGRTRSPRGKAAPVPRAGGRPRAVCECAAPSAASVPCAPSLRSRHFRAVFCHRPRNIVSEAGFQLSAVVDEAAGVLSVGARYARVLRPPTAEGEGDSKHEELGERDALSE